MASIREDEEHVRKYVFLADRQGRTMKMKGRWTNHYILDSCLIIGFSGVLKLKK